MLEPPPLFRQVHNHHYIFRAEERAEFLVAEPAAAPYLHPFVGGSRGISARWEALDSSPARRFSLHIVAVTASKGAHRCRSQIP